MRRVRYGTQFSSPPSGKTAGTHRDFVGNRQEVAETVSGVR